MVEKMFQEPGIPGTLLLITDGALKKTRESFVRFCESSGHQLIVYGVGSKEQKQPESDNNGIFGGAFIPLAEKELQTLAKDCNGFYLEVTPDKSDISRISRRIDFNFVSTKDHTRPWIDSGYFLLFPIAAIFVLWFRKGWTLTWGIVFIISALWAGPGPAVAGDKNMVGMWLTSDQQGRYYFEKGNYEQAANCFENILWKGAAFYMNENFEAAIEMFAQIETPEGYFNLANAYAHSRHYGKAVDAYHRVLALNPHHEAAKKNLGVISGVIDEINAASAAQKGEPGEAVEQLADDSAEAAGAQQVVFGKKDVEFFTAQQILNNPELNEIWMRQVQQDPARFLRMKFQMQLNRQTQENMNSHGK